MLAFVGARCRHGTLAGQCAKKSGLKAGFMPGSRGVEGVRRPGSPWGSGAGRWPVQVKPSPWSGTRINRPGSGSGRGSRSSAAGGARPGALPLAGPGGSPPRGSSRGDQVQRCRRARPGALALAGPGEALPVERDQDQPAGLREVDRLRAGVQVQRWPGSPWGSGAGRSNQPRQAWAPGAGPGPALPAGSPWGSAAGRPPRSLPLACPCGSPHRGAGSGSTRRITDLIARCRLSSALSLRGKMHGSHVYQFRAMGHQGPQSASRFFPFLLRSYLTSAIVRAHPGSSGIVRYTFRGKRAAGRRTDAGRAGCVAAFCVVLGVGVP